MSRASNSRPWCERGKLVENSSSCCFESCALRSPLISCAAAHEEDLDVVGGFETLGCVPGAWEPPSIFRSFHPLLQRKTAWASLVHLRGSSGRQIVPFLASVPVHFFLSGFGCPWASLWRPDVHSIIHLCHPCPVVCTTADPRLSASHRYHARRSRSLGEVSMRKGGVISSSFDWIGVALVPLWQRRGDDGLDNSTRLRRSSAAHASVWRKEKACEDACHVIGTREPGRRARSAR